MSDSNRVAIVTGASRGIGAAVARRLAGEGYTVIINYAGSVGPAEALAAEIEKAGGKALTIQADVSDPKAVARMFEVAYGGIDLLVNNADIMKLARLEAGHCRPPVGRGGERAPSERRHHRPGQQRGAGAQVVSPGVTCLP
jgi:NAD(P)-dependent dehydrogenase (short-subunit alcohol dehydrogenase family)